MVATGDEEGDLWVFGCELGLEKMFWSWAVENGCGLLVCSFSTCCFCRWISDLETGFTFR